MMPALRRLSALVLISLPASALPPVDSVADLIFKGREALEAGRAEEAQQLFDAAALQDKDSLRTRIWVLRGWMEQGRVNDSLDAIDALAKDGAGGPAIDYLYGMAFARKARGYRDTMVADGPVQMALEDAVQYLDRAVKADPDLARDAFLPLAEAAWLSGKLGIAREAAEAAVRRHPDLADAQLLLGRVALSQFSAVKDDESRVAEAGAHWEVARNAFLRAVESLQGRTDATSLDALVRARVNLGHAFVWKQQLAEAQREYATAMALKPPLVNMGEIHRAIGGERFLAAVEGAMSAIQTRAGADPADVATLTWWLGWARFDQKLYEKAEEAFLAAVAREPRFLNAWQLIARARLHLKDFEGSLAALRRHWDEDPADLVAAVAADPESNLELLDGLVAWCAAGGRSAEAAFLSELETNAAPDESRHWNNAGLFWRDAGEQLQKSDRPEDAKEAQADFEKSWRAYTKALELDPESPALLNDAAVILHYYLRRDLERARAMYTKAAERARLELLRADLKADLRELTETALRDSTDNLAKLETEIRKGNG